MTQPAHSGNHTGAIYDRSVASMVLGIVAIVVPYLGWISGIIAIVFASKTLSAYTAASSAGAGTIISRKTQKPVTRVFAIAGLVTGIIGVAGGVFWTLLIALLDAVGDDESTLAVSSFASLLF